MHSPKTWTGFDKIPVPLTEVSEPEEEKGSGTHGTLCHSQKTYLLTYYFTGSSVSLEYYLDRDFGTSGLSNT